jgi:multidrug resistance efflux pump
MSDKFDDIVTNWRLMIPIILAATGLVIAIKFGIEYTLLTWDHITTADAQIKAAKVQVSAEVSGRLLAVHVEEGMAVRRGDLLAEIDATAYRAEVEQGRALLEGIEHQLAAARYDLALAAERYRGALEQAQALLSRRRLEVAEAETALALEQARARSGIAERRAALAMAQAQAAESLADLDRAQRQREQIAALVAAGVVAHDRLEAAQSALAQAKARYEQAQHRVEQAVAQLAAARASGQAVQMRRQRLEALRAAVRQEEAQVQLAWMNLAATQAKEREIAQLAAQRRALEARLTLADLQLARTRLTSPRDGIVILRKAQAGEWVERGTPVLVLADLAELWVVTNIRESEIAGVQTGSRARIWVDAYPERRFEGEVVSVGAAALSELGEQRPTEFFAKIEQRIPVRIALRQPDHGLKAGMMVWVGIERRRPLPARP